jgi:hypothetical protein
MKGTILDAHYNPIVGANIMSQSFAYALFGDIPSTPSNKLLKSPLGPITQSSGIVLTFPIENKGIQSLLNFFIFEISEFNLLIGHPLERLLQEGQNQERINGKVGKSINLSILRTQSVHSKAEYDPEQEPSEEVMAASLLESFEPNLDDGAQHFIEEEEEPQEPLKLDETLKPS